MSDYGISISHLGKDVKNCSEIDMVLTSSRALLKGTLSGSGSTTVVDGGVNTITIAHGLGYIPTVQAFGFDNSGYLIQLYFQMPVYDIGDWELAWTAEADATNVYLKFNWTDFLGSGSINVLYKYFIYLDKGKL